MSDIDVFISYKSERAPAAAHLSDVIKAHGYTVWYDYALIAGTSFSRQIDEKLNAAKVVIVLWCSKSVDSAWVKHEALVARHNGTFLPVMIEDCVLPDEFKDDQCLDLSAWDARPAAYEPDDLVESLEDRLPNRPRANRDALRQLKFQWEKYGKKDLKHFALSAPLPERDDSKAPPKPENRTEYDPVTEVVKKQVGRKEELRTPEPADPVEEIFESIDSKDEAAYIDFAENFADHPLADLAFKQVEEIRLTKLLDGYDLYAMSAFLTSSTDPMVNWKVKERVREVKANAPDGNIRKEWEEDAADNLLSGRKIPEVRIPYIECLNLEGTAFSNMIGLIGLSNLRELNISSSEVSDVGALAGLSNLQILDISYTEVSDVSALSGLVNLKRLYLHRSKVKDTSALDQIKGLEIYGVCV